ncbi:protein ALTERED PHOSPHATE STARVATION RESPONSE 1 [Magnolia sinica]|uniref:protein ALTERED PHOSPHATE STARVATION RESPONSE 1 n=1 Tax=Magnolia sinica TaxID=86752 RepID=UPI0026588A6D|nr:protein ALTERED PHOSPHATE STARVATION RESPONSE 1 [Magnolia sinica]
MGCSNSKAEKSEALRLCKERKKFIKQAIDSRYALAAAHLCYIQSLRSIGIALRRFAEAEVLIESSLSTSATEVDKTPSHSSYPSPSHSHNAEMIDSPLHNESPFSPRISTTSYMRLGGSTAVTVRMDPSLNRFIEDESLSFPPPPPPPPEIGSWDFFDPVGSTQNHRFHSENAYGQNFDNLMNLRQFREEEGSPFMEVGKWEKVGLKGNDDIFIGSISPEFEPRAHESSSNQAARGKSSGRLMMSTANSFNGFASERSGDLKQTQVGERKMPKVDLIANGPVETLAGNALSEQCNSKREEKKGPEKEVSAEREDPSEFITHRAKDFLSSIKDIEHCFLRASDSGKAVSRMLEANKIQLSCSETKGRSTGSIFLAACHLVCCKGESELVPHEPPQHVTKVITWNRSTSSQSSSSKNPLAASRDDIDDSGSDFVEEFCMISGRHSSTLERLYAWERKLYDEVKASESIRKDYDQKCNLLRHQFARDLSTHVIDKTRAIVKDLHSRIKVSIHAVDSIAKRIEKLRDDELQPQLVELIQGSIRMWKAMLECHHTQYITITLAYHARSSTTASQSESHRQVVVHLQHEIESFGSSFVDWIGAHKSYVEALNSWLQNCILPSQERSWGRRMAFSPRRVLAPPIFVLCRDWLAGIKALPYEELSDAIKGIVSNLHGSFGQRLEEQQKKEEPNDMDSNRGSGRREDEEKCNRLSNLSSLQASLTRAFDRLTKFAEASLKLYEDIRQASETARVAYTNGRMRF